MNKISDIIKRIYNSSEKNENNILSDIEYLLSLGSNEAEILFKAADTIRKKHVGGGIYLRAIIEFSSYCKGNCAYCGLRSSNSDAARYRLTEKKIVQYALAAVKVGYTSLVLQSGEDPFYTKETVGVIIKQIKSAADVIITLSLGERSYDEYKYWRECGADRFLIKHETSNEKIYNDYHEHSSFARRIKCQNDLYSLGYDLGSGFMTGLPGTTLRDYAHDLLFIKNQRCAMAGIGPFIAHDKTPLVGKLSGDLFITQKCVAILRVLIPSCNIPATTAYEVLGGNLMDLINSGANVIMRKVEESGFAKQYEIYPKKTPEFIDIANARCELKKKLILNGCYVNNTG